GAYVAWCAKLPDTRTSGWSGSPSITTGVTEKYNTTLGMSIVKYVGNGTAGATIPHSLGKKPFMVIVKKLSAAGTNWFVYHEAVGATKYLVLDNTTAAATFTLAWNDTEPTSQLITLGSGTDTNTSGGEYIAYIFCETDSCKPIEYTGNGSTDGAFVNLGISPEWSLAKPANTTGVWSIRDIVRSPSNPIEDYLFANSSGVEAVHSTMSADFVSTGIKARGTNSSDWNHTSIQYIGLAIGRPTQATKGS
ncbi:MAG: hypothetical protein OQJ97_09050, partial [Rhodospirillales bacterium]|nr:hypothetical protein [Rhodospirillales bacterium]